MSTPMTAILLRLLIVYLWYIKHCATLHKHDFSPNHKSLSFSYCYYFHFIVGELEARDARYHMEGHAVRKAFRPRWPGSRAQSLVCLSVSFNSLWFLGGQGHLFHLYIPVTHCGCSMNVCGMNPSVWVPIWPVIFRWGSCMTKTLPLTTRLRFGAFLH